jgi:surface carbohydrate biosynthesis protein
MVIFNHLYATHLAEWSRRLADMGVLVAVLLNEGIVYDDGEMRYIAGRHYEDAHADIYFCWNEPHRQAILAHNAFKGARVEVIGVPRFDFYVEPWSRLIYRPDTARRTRPQILVCTNFVTARYWELPREAGDKFFAPWVGKIPLFDDYWVAVECHWKGRQRVLDYLGALVGADKYEIVVRPHPREDVDFYARWIDALDESQRRHIRIDSSTNISALILACDLELSCETCTTAIESWIARKPTIELLFERHPLWYREEHTVANVPCGSPEELPALVERELANPLQTEKAEIRRHHLEKWCYAVDGHASARLVDVAASAIRAKKPAAWSQLTINDYRRAAKLFATQKLGQAYHFDILLPLKRALIGDRYAIKEHVYQKSVKPADVVRATQKFERALQGSPAGNG